MSEIAKGTGVRFCSRKITNFRQLEGRKVSRFQAVSLLSCEAGVRRQGEAATRGRDLVSRVAD